MRIWLITVGEPLPIDGSNERLYRTGMIAQLLSMQGHEVLWWTSNYDHARKKQREYNDSLLVVNNKLSIKLLKTSGYQKNISINRILDHKELELNFIKEAKLHSKPDIILCSLPTLGLSEAAVLYGRKEDVPVVVDIRDLWPDIFIEVVPKKVSWLIKLILYPAYKKAQLACSSASAIFGITPAFVDWGLKYAKRTKSYLDRDFPLAYSKKTPDNYQLMNAEKFWKDMGINETQFIVCFFGNMAENVLQLEPIIESAIKLRDKKEYAFKFVLCGNGNSFDYYKKLSSNCESIIMPGRVGAAEIWTLMRLSSVGIIPYQSRKDFMESLPNKSIEYLSSGLPILSSLKGLLQKLLYTNKCGFTYEEGNSEEITEILLRLYNEQVLLKTMSDNALALYKKQFVAEEVYKNMIDHLELICTEYKSEKRGK